MERNTDDWIDTYMRYTDETEPPKRFHKWVGIFCITAAMKREMWTQVEFSKPWYPNLYVVLVAPSGKARKSTAIGYGEELLKQVKDVNMASEAVTREALIMEMQDCYEEKMNGTEIIEHSSISVMSGELTSFIRFNNLQFLSDLTDWYDCKDLWVNRTKTQGTDEINGVWLNLLGATTPHSLQSSVPEDMIGGGFTSRIVLVYADQKEEVKAPTWGKTNTEEEMKEALVEDLKQISSLAGEFKPTKKANDAYTELYSRMHNDPPVQDRHFMGYNSRRQVHMVKTAMACSMSRNNETILKEEDILRAHEFLNEVEKHMPRTFLGYGHKDQSELYKILMEYIAKERTTNTSAVWRAFHRDFEDQEQMVSMIRQLAKADIINVSNKGELTEIKLNEESEDAQQLLDNIETNHEGQT